MSLNQRSFELGSPPRLVTVGDTVYTNPFGYLHHLDPLHRRQLLQEAGVLLKTTVSYLTGGLVRRKTQLEIFNFLEDCGWACTNPFRVGQKKIFRHSLLPEHKIIFLILNKQSTSWQTRICVTDDTPAYRHPHLFFAQCRWDFRRNSQGRLLLRECKNIKITLPNPVDIFAAYHV